MQLFYSKRDSWLYSSVFTVALRQQSGIIVIGVVSEVVSTKGVFLMPAGKESFPARYRLFNGVYSIFSIE